MPRDQEWEFFVGGNDNLVDPKLPVRNPEQIQYPGKDAPAAAEVRAGMLERKSKYLKSYTPGWYGVNFNILLNKLIDISGMFFRLHICTSSSLQTGWVCKHRPCPCICMNRN